MSEEKKSFLNQRQAIELAFAVKQYVAEKNEPFTSYERAVEWFAKTLNFHVTKANIQSACENIKIEKQKVVLGGASSIGGMTSRCFKRIEELTSELGELKLRIAKIENDLK
jgi:hypothetical protein